MKKLKDMRIVITGVGLKPVAEIFPDIVTGEPSHTPVFDTKGTEYKANIGTATAYECAKEGATVHLISRTDDNLKIVKNWIIKDIPDAKVEYTPVDLSEAKEIEGWVNGLPKDKLLYWVQSVGIGSGHVKIDRPYTKIEDTSIEQLNAELLPVTSTLSMFKTLLPRFRRQPESRIAIVSSMSAVRAFPGGVPHCAGKGALSMLANAAKLELNKDRIYVTEVRPGMVDTGMYDGDIGKIGPNIYGSSYCYQYKGKLPMMPAGAVGEEICNALKSRAHIISVNMVAKGQAPHEMS